MDVEDGRRLILMERAVAHLLGAVDVANRHLDGDLTMGAVLVAVIQARLQMANGPQRPVTGGFLAARLGMPNETVRRKVNALLARGHLVREGGGLSLAPGVLEHPDIAHLLRPSEAEFQRLCAAIERA